MAMADVQKALARLVPFACVWDGYSAREQRSNDFKMRIDFFAVPCFAMWYLLLGTLAAAPRRGESADTGADPDVFQALAATGLAVAAPYVFLLQLTAMPAPTADTDAFHAQEKLGRWVYLTSHCLCLQAWHQLFSFSNLVFPQPWLADLTCGMCPFIAVLGSFVTLQYFALVAPHPKFREECALWERRGVRLQAICHAIHLPALPVALIDLCVGQPICVARAASVPQAAALVAIYAALYFGFVFLNNRWTGHWPYGVMRALAGHPGRWAGFAVSQALVCAAIVALVWCLLQGRALHAHIAAGARGGG